MIYTGYLVILCIAMFCTLFLNKGDLASYMDYIDKEKTIKLESVKDVICLVILLVLVVYLLPVVLPLMIVTELKKFIKRIAYGKV